MTPRLRRQGPRLRRAAMRRWGLTARRGQANPPDRAANAPETYTAVGQRPTGRVLVFSFLIAWNHSNEQARVIALAMSILKPASA
jgi:hypothetical protein